MALNIVVDENIPFAHEFFSSLGVVTRLPGRNLNTQHLQNADILIVRSVTQVNEELLAATPVKFVGTCTIGIDHLDVDYLQTQGIAYHSAPGCNANSVVEYVFSALCQLGVNWNQKMVGIIGCGNVGGRLYQRLRELGVKCRCYDPFLSSKQLSDLSSLEAVLACDIVCLHAPITHTGTHPTHHLLAHKELEQLIQGAVLINAGRGAVIDNSALLDTLKGRNDLKVVLDVWEHEPKINTELMQYVDIATPHIAGYSLDGKMAGTDMVYRSLCEFLSVDCCFSGGKILNAMAINKKSYKTLIETKSLDFCRLQELILTAYNIDSDNVRMRKALMGKTGIALAESFDKLRKNYPERREFHAHENLFYEIERCFKAFLN